MNTVIGICRSTLTKFYYKIVHGAGLLYSENTLEPNATHLGLVLKSETNLDVFMGLAQDVYIIYIYGYLTPRQSSEIRNALQQAWMERHAGNLFLHRTLSE